MFGIHRLGGVRIAKVIRHYYEPKIGQAVCDVVDASGNTWVQCRISQHTEAIGNANEAAGEQNSFSNWVPPVTDPMADDRVGIDDTGDVLIGLSGGNQPQAYVIGAIYTPKIWDHITTKNQDLGDSKDYGPQNNVKDTVTVHRGVRMVFASSGTWLLDTKKTKKPIRFEIDKTSFVRISQNGAADEYVLLANATLDHLVRVHSRIDTVVDILADIVLPQVSAYYTALAAAANTAVPGSDVPGSGGNADKAIQAASSTLSLKATDYPFDFTKRDALKAACFRISALSIDDQGGGS